jgi:hypothetical protein
MKSPPVQYDDDEAHELVEDFIRANARVTRARSAPTETTA